jgi:GNAT superfamily N-acetyltransferase
MLEQLEKQLLDIFIAQRTDEPEDISALNVAALRLSRLPYFGDTYSNQFIAQKGEHFFKRYFGFKNDEIDLDPLRREYHDSYSDYYDEDDKEIKPPSDYFPIHHPNCSIKDTVPFQGELPAAIEIKAQAYLDQLMESSAQMKMASNPSSQDLDNKRNLAVSLIDHDDLHATLNGLLGEGYAYNLKPNGIQYHDPSGGFGGKKDWRYLIAHNDNEVAGVLGFIHNSDDRTMGLSYVSVAPGFQGQGLSLRLYQGLIDYAKEHQSFIQRSSPTEFTRKNPAITLAYDRLLEQSDVLHTSTDTYLNKVIMDALKILPYEQVLRDARDACNAITREVRKNPDRMFSYEAQEFDRAVSAELREKFAPPAKPKRPKP